MSNGCWASSLGDCQGGITAEHYVSECIFPGREVMVKGFPWCRQEHKAIRIERLVRNMLCEEHNSALSPVDAVMPKIFKTLEDASALMDARRKVHSRSWTVKHFRIDVRLLERWCLKTLINVSYPLDFDVSRGTGTLAVPSNELVKIAFGRSEFMKPAGLYLQAAVNEHISLRAGVSITKYGFDKDELNLGQFDLFGLRFVLNLLPKEVESMDGSQLLYQRVKSVFNVKDDKGRDVRSHVLDLS